MKKIARLAVPFAVLSLSILMVIVSCKKDEDEPEETSPAIPELNEFTLYDNVVVLDSVTTPEPIIDGNRYTYKYTEQPPDFKIGDIIIGYTNGGYLKKIIDIETQKQEGGFFVVVLILGKALFEEVFENCNFDIIIPVYTNEISLDGTVLWEDQIGSVDLDIIIQEGWSKTDLSVNFKLVRVNGETQLFSIVGTGDADFSAETIFEATGDVAYDNEIKLLTFPFPFLIGPVPAKFSLDIYGGFNTNIHSDGHLIYTCSVLVDVEVGATYTNTDNWNATWEKNVDFIDDEIEWNCNFSADAQMYLKPEIKLSICGSVGGSFNVRPYLDLNANVNNQQWMWDFNGGIDGEVGYDITVLGLINISSYSNTFDIYSYDIASDQGTITANQPPSAIMTVDPSSGTTSTIFEFDGSGSFDNEDPTSDLQVRWDFDGDGTWDTGWDYDKTENHQYSTEGTYTAKMEVKDTEGLTDYATQTVTVDNGGGGSGTFTDPRDGQEYEYVEIGSQTWMAENLNYETGNSWCYDNDPSNCDTYGRLYDWSTALGACPSGWHLPSDEEWCTLTTYIDPTVDCNAIGWSGTDAGYKMKSTSGWYSNGNGSDAYGFAALPGGRRSSYGLFNYIEKDAYFWSSTEDGTDAWGRRLNYNYDGVCRGYGLQDDGFSVRCLKD